MNILLMVQKQVSPLVYENGYMRTQLQSALDTFNTAVIPPTYYVLFTSFTILANIIMFKDWDTQNASQIATELCGFVTILSGTFLLHKTKDMGNSQSLNSSSFIDQENVG
ncbi:hypothetical protein QYF36_026118 [Acer negundo]|nr:hypothetical protein QYF36_026118 [Acer negundo]